MEQAVNETLTCALVEERALVERYVADTLTDAHGRADFEAHVIACPRCQDEIRLAMTVRAELAPLVAGTRRARRVWPLGLGIALAAGIAAVVVFRGGEAGARALGALREPPLYLGVPVRATATPADSIFVAAMAAYDDRHYGDAAAGLTRALAAGVDSAPALFFLGASELMAGRPSAAATAWHRVIGLGDTPYLPEAHYYRAKALLQLGDRAAALAELAAVPVTGTAIADQAAALTDSVRKLARR